MVPAAEFEAFAAAGLAQLEAPFTAFYRDYRNYQIALAEWQAGQTQTASADAIPAALTAPLPAAPQRPARTRVAAPLAAAAAAKPAATRLTYAPVETLIAEDPQVIVVGDANYGVCPADVMARPGWSDMTAVKEGAVRPVDDIPVTRPGPRLAEGLASLAQAIHPEIELAEAPAAFQGCAAA